jgi:hypothetical protein
VEQWWDGDWGGRGIPKNTDANLCIPLHMMERHTTTTEASSLTTDLYSEITWTELGPIAEKTGFSNGSSVRYFSLPSVPSPHT